MLILQVIFSVLYSFLCYVIFGLWTHLEQEMLLLCFAFIVILYVHSLSFLPGSYIVFFCLAIPQSRIKSSGLQPLQIIMKLAGTVTSSFKGVFVFPCLSQITLYSQLLIQSKPQGGNLLFFTIIHKTCCCRLWKAASLGRVPHILCAVKSA